MIASTPAILGGSAAFPDRLHLLRPTLPSFADLEPRLRELYTSGIVTKGPILADYERALAEHLGVRHALAVSSCTAGLMLVFDRYRGADVVLPSFTFMATAMAAVWAGLEPVFADIDPDTWCLSPAAADAAVTADTALVAPVHVFGNPADTAAFDALGRRRRLPIVYDAAHGFGALSDGAPVGRQGLAQVFSTSPTKLLITGEGGVVATDDDALAERVVVGREYGNPGTYDLRFAGLNARLPEASAVLGLEGLALLEREAERRNALAAVYRELLGALPGIAFQRVAPAGPLVVQGLLGAHWRRRVRPHARPGRHGARAPRASTRAPTTCRRCTACRPSRRWARRSRSVCPQTAALCDEVLTLPAYGRLDGRGRRARGRVYDCPARGGAPRAAGARLVTRP